MEPQCDKKYPVTSAGYELLEEIGQGVSATVYRARCIPFSEVVAVKCLDLEKCVSNLDGIRREAQMMSLISHPNVVKAYCSFVVEQTLWVVMPYMAGGSCLHLMKSAYPEGLEEPVIATVLKASLKALEYLHRHGHIHRDVKAGNILMDYNGAIKLGDYGVSACMFDTGDRQRSRNTFVGTPCWMAPEVMEPLNGYDFKADIWSFGITGLELAHGHAPFSKYPPMKVLLMTLKNAPPGLDYERDKRFSKMFKEMIAMCLVKDPAKRPTAEKLLKHSFFKNARNSDYVLHHVLDGLPSLGDRVQTLKMKDAVNLAQKKMPSGEWEELSQKEYQRGVSSWNFNVEDLKAQAAMIEDDFGSKGALVMEEMKVPKVHDAPDVVEAPPKFPVKTQASSNGNKIDQKDLKDRVEDSIIPMKTRDRKDDKDGVVLSKPAAIPTLPEDRPVVEAVPAPVISANSRGADAFADGGFETRANPLTRSESMASPHKKAGDAIVRSASQGRWDKKQVGRFNVYGSTGDLRENINDHDSGDGRLGRKEDGAASCRHGEEKVKAGIVQKKGRFSITEDVETPLDREREHQQQINELQNRISNLLEELQAVKSRNAELERQASGEGSAGKDLTAPTK